MKSNSIGKDGISLEKAAIPIRPKRTDVRDQLQQASQMYEKHFLNEMLRAMRSSVSKSDLMPESMGEKIYSQELDQEYIKSWVARGGIGLSKIIYDQMAERFGLNQMAPKGGLPLSPSSGMFKVNEVPSANPKKIKLDIESSKPEASVTTPWDAKVLSWLPEPQSAKGHLLLSHPEGVQSVWSLPQKPNLQIGQELLAGDSILDSVGSEKLSLELRYNPS